MPYKYKITSESILRSLDEFQLLLFALNTSWISLTCKITQWVNAWPTDRMFLHMSELILLLPSWITSSIKIDESLPVLDNELICFGSEHFGPSNTLILVSQILWLISGLSLFLWIPIWSSETSCWFRVVYILWFGLYVSALEVDCDTFTSALWSLLVMSMTVVFGFFFTALTMFLSCSCSPLLTFFIL